MLKTRNGVPEYRTNIYTTAAIVDVYATADGTIVQSSAQIEQADALELTFARGGAQARVTAKREA